MRGLSDQAGHPRPLGVCSVVGNWPVTNPATAKPAIGHKYRQRELVNGPASLFLIPWRPPLNCTFINKEPGIAEIDRRMRIRLRSGKEYRLLTRLRLVNPESMQNK